MTWLEGKPGRVEQRRREHHRRNKAESMRSYRVRRAMGLTARHWTQRHAGDYMRQELIGKVSRRKK